MILGLKVEGVQHEVYVPIELCCLIMAAAIFF